jgi:hypothetical protein
MRKRITSEIPLVDPQIANPETRDLLRGCGGFFSGLFNPCILLLSPYYQRTGVRLTGKAMTPPRFQTVLGTAVAAEDLVESDSRRSSAATSSSTNSRSFDRSFSLATAAQSSRDERAQFHG